MDDHSSLALEELAQCLANERPLLMAGAGLSKLVGYPLWRELMEELRNALKSRADRNHPVLVNNRYDEYADELVNNAELPENLAPYIRRRFRHQYGHPPFDDCVHTQLIALPFCGIVTTNYDNVLEFASQSYLSREKAHIAADDVTVRPVIDCRHIDLCHENHRSFSFDLLRRLACSAKEPCRDRILHIHGHFENAERVILRRTDYLAMYGQLLPEVGRRATMEVTFHHKVIWSLLVTHPFVFVGFGMDDPYFMKMQKIIQAEFKYGTAHVQPRHFAVLPRHEVTPDLESKLMHSAIRPVPYDLPPGHLPPGPEEAVDRYREGLSGLLNSLDFRLDAAMEKPFERPDAEAELKVVHRTPLAGEVSAKDVTVRMLART